MSAYLNVMAWKVVQTLLQTLQDQLGDPSLASISHSKLSQLTDEADVPDASLSLEDVIGGIQVKELLLQKRNKFTP